MNLSYTVKEMKKKCNDPDQEGTFTFCTQLLKNSYDIAARCRAQSPGCPTSCPTTSTGGVIATGSGSNTETTPEQTAAGPTDTTTGGETTTASPTTTCPCPTTTTGGISTTEELPTTITTTTTTSTKGN